MPVQRHQPTQCPVLRGQGRGHQVLQTFLSTFHIFGLVVRPRSGCIPIFRTKDAPPCLTAWSTTLTDPPGARQGHFPLPEPQSRQASQEGRGIKETPGMAAQTHATPVWTNGFSCYLQNHFSFLTCCFLNNDILVLHTPKGGRLGGEILRHTL